MGWNYLSIPKLQRWRLGMDKWFQSTFYNGYNYLSMLGLKLIHVSKRGCRCRFTDWLIPFDAWNKEINCAVYSQNTLHACDSCCFQIVLISMKFTYFISRSSVIYRGIWKLGSAALFSDISSCFDSWWYQTKCRSVLSCGEDKLLHH